MVRRLRLMTEDMKEGVWIEENEFLQIAKVCKTRNTSMFKKLKEDYAYLFKDKFPEKL